MPKLELDYVLREGVPALFTDDAEIQAEALSRFRSDLEQMDASGGLTKDSLSELVFENSYTQAHLSETVERGLSGVVAKGTDLEFNMFLSGATVVCLDSNGSMGGVYESPNVGFPQSVLGSQSADAHKSQLRLALLNAGLAAVAHTSGYGGPEEGNAYLHVENIIRRSKGLAPIKELGDVRFRDLHQLGGAVRHQDPAAHNSLGTRLCGVSGVLLDERIARSLVWEKATQPKGLIEPFEEVALRVVAKHARKNGALNDTEGRMYEGNLFAGSLNSALARFVLDVGRAPIGLEHIVHEAVVAGINVH